MIPTNPQELFSPFLPTTYNIPEEEDRLYTFLVDQFSTLSDVVNDKTIGAFSNKAENFDGEKWGYVTAQHPDTSHVRNGYQSMVYIPSFPNTGVLILTGANYPIKNIGPQFVVTQLYGTASKPPTYVNAGNGDFFEYNNRGDPRIIFDMSDINITITTFVDLSMYSGYILIKYLRDGT